MEDDFSTIEHDFLHTMDYFSNYKFTYKERKSKLDFFQNIGNASVQDTTGLLESAKAQLVEVKQQYKGLDEEIRALSQAIYDHDVRIAQKTEALAGLSAQERALAEECAGLAALDEKLRINDGLNSELDEVESEIKDYYARIDQGRAIIDSSAVRAKQEEEAALKSIRGDLITKQKRLTVINTDSYTEDIYYWYQQAQCLLQGVFGALDVQMVDGRVVLRITVGKSQISVTLNNRRMETATISGSPSEEMARRFHEHRGYCVEVNNMMLLLAKTFLLD